MMGKGGVGGLAGGVVVEGGGGAISCVHPDLFFFFFFFWTGQCYQVGLLAFRWTFPLVPVCSLDPAALTSNFLKVSLVLGIN